ncbi:unnamed protein product [Rotaria socialis]|uniref:Uncharacterized protein n=1 Tax=Rotaria socialis TaxID=392032 RepID=A0A818ZNJ7_9BILA|nr:unnamed protein product [Rotaria socialis]CAF3394822.1 unnamed protein product [Rotaria socialis]CAF3771608.1 unnamed protein product [Rotaria socialis]CAF4217671.1 unnamed protein product [Rotaria socialis]CAF4505197.1 unnamed protein product [Rotaria socialis]
MDEPQREPQSNAPNAQFMAQLGNKLSQSTRTYITRSDRDAIRLALEDFQAILHAIGSNDTLEATHKVKQMAGNLQGKYGKLFARVVNQVGNCDTVNIEDIEIIMNTNIVDVDQI